MAFITDEHHELVDTPFVVLKDLPEVGVVAGELIVVRHFRHSTANGTTVGHLVVDGVETTTEIDTDVWKNRTIRRLLTPMILVDESGTRYVVQGVDVFEHHRVTLRTATYEKLVLPIDTPELVTMTVLDVEDLMVTYRKTPKPVVVIETFYRHPDAQDVDLEQRELQVVTARQYVRAAVNDILDRHEAKGHLDVRQELTLTTVPPHVTCR